ncbi:hypothetical protein LPJ73_000915 [Coemansia sp. RSA 2703]|nr:hypothetical protein LPJ73_000915 [Coemansia sp. RSA 2703]KAJ2367628.1 hypothetical protein IW150_005623 [Coemansia sp. RSA 2607]KAJ2395738.1 hypothetical protein GGI05_001445 [Coemansia sp. RSA 2603]
MVPTEIAELTTSRVRNIIFLGTGTSGCIPNLPCITENNPRCKVCKLSMTDDGRKNRRRNTSLLVRVDHPDGRIRNILIDCGKSFYESARDVFLKHNIRTVDAVLLTHGHADAVFGLDDLRQWTMSLNLKIPIYCDRDTLGTVAQAFPYLVDTKKATGGGEVPSLDFHVIEEPFRSFECLGLEIQPLRVEHGSYSDGSPFYFTGFRFADISYISDCSRIPEETRPLIAGSRLLILDALKWTSHPSHFGYWDALEEVRRFRPDRAIFTDFCHSIEHTEMEAMGRKLKEEEGLNVDPAFDGMVVDM